MTYHSNNIAQIAIIKHVPTLDPTISIQSQTQLINIPGPESNESGSNGVNAYEALRSCIRLVVGPYFEAYAVDVEPNGNYGDSKMGIGIPMVKKKISELELSLLHLQGGFDIPQISLNIHPVVQRAVEKRKREPMNSSVDDIIDPQLLCDSTFLNKLQSNVNGWIREIQKVTNLTHDPASGTATQEINFWLNMEAALMNIGDKMKSDEITLTMDILKYAKRFHATVSFITDTGIKEATEKACKYNLLMKDFPLDELLSATNIVKVKDALLVVFNHFNRKLKLSPYPIEKALLLAEAISCDLNEKLLEVLRKRHLMHMAYDDFERVISGAEDVFKTWEQCIREFTNVVRDVARKRDKFIPVVINSAHDKLQERINFIKGFRKQHEQLQYEQLLHAFEEVRLSYESAKDIDMLDVSFKGNEIWTQMEDTYNKQASNVNNLVIASLKNGDEI